MHKQWVSEVEEVHCKLEMDSIMPKNKKGGVVTNVVFGVGSLILAVIVILMITQTLSNASLISDDSTNTYTIVNETITFPSDNAVQSLSVSSLLYVSCGTPTSVTNQTATGELLTVGNFTIAGCTITNATALSTAVGNGTVFVSYPYTITETYSKDSVTNLTSNFTSGIDNISEKIPTILLIVAVVILFGALVLLIRNTKLMGVFGGNGGSL